MTILVTGGAGYVGSVLTEMLLENGYTVTVLDNLMFRQQSLLGLCHKERLSFVKGDARDQSLIKKLVSKHDVLIPLAALVGAPLCEKNKKDAISINLEAIKKILKSLKKKNKLIYLTTNSGYGIGEKNKFCDEKSLLKPISLYGQTKCDAESEVMKFKNTISFRLATVFGASYRMRSDLLVNNFVLVLSRDLVA